MATPKKLDIFPSCGLEIEVENDLANWDGADHTDIDTLWRYKITNKDRINEMMTRPTNKRSVFEGFLSPTSPLTLPRMIRVYAGIPVDAKSYCFMYPPEGLADFIFNSMPRRGSSANVVSLDSMEQSPLLDAAILGGFAYFDGDMKCLAVNAVSRVRTENQLRFSGPFKVSETACSELVKMSRARPLRLDSFREAGYARIAWVRPMESFGFDPCLPDFTHRSGCLVFLRSNGTGAAYAVDASGYVDPKGKVDFLSDALGNLGDSSFTGVALGSISREKALMRKSYAVQSSERGLRKGTSTGSLDNMKTVLHKACQAMLPIEDVRQLLSDATIRENILQRDEFGWNPLHYACRFSPRNIELIRLLTEASPDAALQVDHYNRYPLHIACLSDTTTEVVLALLALDTNVPKITISGTTRRFGFNPLHFACYNCSSVEVVHILCDADPEKKTLVTPTKKGQLPLHMAILKNFPAATIQLFLDAYTSLSKDKDVEESDLYVPHEGQIPLHLACINSSSSEIAKILLQRDVLNLSIDHTLGNSRLNVTASSRSLGTQNSTSSGKSPDAFQNNPPKTIPERSSSADSNSVFSYSKKPLSDKPVTNDANNGVVALHMAMKHGEEKLIALLLQQEKEKQRRDGDGLSTLHRRDANGCTPLHIACQSNIDPFVIKQLLKLDKTKEIVHVKDKIGYLPVHYACENIGTNEKTIDFLFAAEEQYIDYRRKKGKEVRRSTHVGDRFRKRTPLHLAVTSGSSTEVLSRLLTSENFTLQGFDPSTMDDLAKMVSKSKHLQEKVVMKLSERLYFIMLALELTANLAGLIFFLIGSKHLVNGGLTKIEPGFLMFAASVFTIREGLQVMSLGVDYLRDVWSFFENASIVLLFLSARHMLAAVDNPEIEIKRNVLTASGVLLTITCMLFLKSTVLPFARFVGGLLQIFQNLIPFVITSFLFLLAFAYAYWIQGDSNCPSLESCVKWTVSGLLSFSRKRDLNVIDLCFGFVIVIVLLNVLIAIVSEAWADSANASNQMFWAYRLERIEALGFLADLRVCTRVTSPKRSPSLWDRIDDLKDISIVKDVDWTKKPYNLVKSKAQYDRPQDYFPAEIARDINLSHSLHATLFWAKNDARVAGTELTGIAKLHIILSFFASCIVYALLILLGLVTFGTFWPKRFRNAMLQIGMDEADDYKNSNNDSGGEMKRVYVSKNVIPKVPK